MLELNKIHKIDALNIPWDLPDGLIDCCVTSPPYWGLRDYGVEGQLGLEPTFQEYISKLCDIFDEVKRVLKNTGTCWVNLGDTYGTGSGSGSRAGDKQGTNRGTNYYDDIGKPGVKGMQKCLLQIPHRFSIEMCNRGWILRSTIIWAKKNPMPESVRDRPTTAHEYIFMFTKSKRYYFDMEAVKVLASENTHSRGKGSNPKAVEPGQGIKQNSDFNRYLVNIVPYRNIRTVWTVQTQPFPGAHFAVFPGELIEPPIKAGCPEWMCKKCGKPREKIIEKGFTNHDGKTNTKYNKKKTTAGRLALLRQAARERGEEYVNSQRIVGWTDCDCGAGFEPGIVLDPFMGTGTTALVARKLSRQFIGFDLKDEYVEMARKRIEPHMQQRKVFDYDDS